MSVEEGVGPTETGEDREGWSLVWEVCSGAGKLLNRLI